MHRSRARRAIVASWLAVALLSSPAVSFAVSRADADAARDRAENARREQTAAQARADRLLTETRTLDERIDRTRTELAGIDGKMTSVETRRAKLEGEMAALRRDVAAKQSEIASATAAYRQRRETLGERIDATYRQGTLFYLELILESRSLNDLVTRTAFVQQVMLEDEDVIARLGGMRRTLEEAKASLDRSLATLTAKKAEAAAEENALRDLQADRATQLVEQRGAQASKQKLLTATKSDVARLQAVVDAEEAEARRIERVLSGGGASRGKGRFAGTMAWPIPGYDRITSEFGWRIHPILGTRRFHAGLDIAAPSGARIVAAGPGTVTFAGYSGGYGNMVMIDHGDGVVTVYAHQSAIAVSKGADVRKGQKIGEIGSTGASTGPHLHFEVRINGDARDPLDYL